jgi:hypothetical protein
MSVSTEGTALELLTAVKNRLATLIPDFGRGALMITDEPVPPDAYFAQGKLACTLCLLDGTFDKRLWAGGGPMQLTETSDLVVTILTHPKLDQPPQAEVALLNDKFGILTRFKPDILRALLVADPAADLLIPWVPVDDDGQYFLRDGGLVPVRSQGPGQVPGRDWIGLSLHFAVQFDWNLRLLPPS